MKNEWLSRRELLTRMGFGIAAASLVTATAPVGAAVDAAALRLPLQLKSLAHHIGISVRDVLKSAEFYSRVYGGDKVFGEKEPFLRYFIAFTAKDASVDAGDVAIGQLGTAGSVGQTKPLIDHLCVEAIPHSSVAWRAALQGKNIRSVGSGVFFDTDGVAIQVAGATDEQMSAGKVTAMPPLYTGASLVKAKGFDHVMLRVSDPEKSAAFYRTVFGLAPSAREQDVIWFSDGDVRLGLRKIRAGEAPAVDTYGVRVAPFNREKVAAALTAMGATVQAPAGSSAQRLGFADPDGIKSVLVATSL